MSNSWQPRPIRILNVLITSIIILSVTACTFEAPRECEKYTEFFLLSMSERENELPHFPAEQQVDICICGMYREPPATSLAYTLAHSGESVIPVLIERLKSRKAEAGQRNIIQILRIVSREGLLRGREDVVEEIQQIVDKMKDKMIRSASEAALDEIKTDLKPLT